MSAPTLNLWPDEADVELPFPTGGEDSGALYNERLGATALAVEVEDLRRALVDALTHVEAGTPAPGNRIRAWRQLAGTTYLDGMTPTERATDGITRAAAKWTEEETAAVDAAIRTVAARRVAAYRALDFRDDAGLYSDETINAVTLTTADVWEELGDGFPVTKGIAGRMLAAKSAGIIANTGRTIIIDPDAAGPNHGQRLTVWRAL